MAFPTEEDLLNMPDDEALELPESKAELQPEKEEGDTTERDKNEDSSTEEDIDTTSEEGDTKTDTEEDGKEEEVDEDTTLDKDDDEKKDTEEGNEKTDKDGDKETDAKDSKDTKGDDKTGKDDKDSDKKESDTEIDYKAEYERLLMPFKANGRNIQVNNVDDAVTLMRMGANYNKKMAGLKPSLRIVKILENADLLNENKLNYLIDLDKHDKNAITKLLADSGLDPHDLISEDKKVDYTPNQHSTVTDADVDLDQVLEDLKDSETYADTMRVAGKEWDNDSRAIIAQDPNILRVLDQHIQQGIYAQIADVMASEKAVGKLAGMADIVAYKHVGDALNAAGAFGSADSTDSSAVSNSQDKPDPEKEEKRNAERKAASPTRKSSSKAKKTSQDFNPLEMSDDDFEKASAEGLYN